MKTKFLLLFWLTTLTAFGQEKFTSYTSAPNETSLEIDISGTSEQNFTLWIAVYSTDKLYKECGFSLDAKNYNEFIINLMEAEKKYKEWRAVAIENQVTSLEKPMTLKMPKCTTYFYSGSKWNFAYAKTPEVAFRVTELNTGTAYWLQVRFKSITSSSNQYMKLSGMVMAFDSPERIQEFLSAISYEKIVLHFKSKGEKESLFKD